MEKVKIIDSDKYMWDGETYTSESEVNTKKAEYEKDNFETRLISEEGNYFLFTRRVVTEVVVEGQPSV